ncbi:MAG TPA: ABC transporter ATP-binding protein, partial [Mycobacteriales bacterium]|nr:ABC transporter ATP-binding protein [Mycobacteriales bacterium]
KSSLALGLLGLLDTNARLEGQVRLGEAQLVGARKDLLRKIRWSEISLVPQSAMNALSPVIRVGEQIVDVILAHQDVRRRQARITAMDMLERVGLDRAHYNAFPHELSGGMRQRAVIAMAIVLMPRLVILDEPTTALDVVTQQRVLEQIMQLRAEFGFSMVFITHDLPLLLEWSDRIGVMYAGSLVEVSGSAQIGTDPLHPYSRMLMDSFPNLYGPQGELATIPGSPWDLRRDSTGCLFADRCDSTMDSCRQVPPALIEHSGRSVACHLHHPPRGGE